MKERVSIDTRLEELERRAWRLELAAGEREQWQAAANKHVNDFLDGLSERPAYREPAGEERALDELPFQEEGRPPDEVLPVYRRAVEEPGINPASGRHLGYVPGGGVFPTALGDYLAAASNRYAGIYFANPGAVRMENQLLRWMCRLVGYPDTALGNLASGGSIANLIAIVTAREHSALRSADIHRACIYLTGQVHHCVQKALRIAGLAEAQLRYVPMDDRYCMDARALKEMVVADQQSGLRPWLVVGSAGATDTGAIDPLDAIAEVAAAHDIWFHIDAAYGGFFLLVEEMRNKFRGIERSDSVAIDPHKGLFLAYGLGAVLIKNVRAQYEAHYYQASYMQDALPDESELSPADLSPELTKHFRGARMWLPLQVYGLGPFRAALAEKALLCRYFYGQAQQLGFAVGPEPELSIMIFRYLPSGGGADAFNEALVAAVREDGRVFLSSTTIDGVFWIRLAVLSFRTHRREIDLALGILRQKRDLLLARNNR